MAQHGRSGNRHLLPAKFWNSLFQSVWCLQHCFYEKSSNLTAWVAGGIICAKFERQSGEGNIPKGNREKQFHSVIFTATFFKEYVWSG